MANDVRKRLREEVDKFLTQIYFNSNMSGQIDRHKDYFITAILAVIGEEIDKVPMSNRYNRTDHKSITSYNEGFDDGHEQFRTDLRARLEKKSEVA
jgi:hypothetical protein